MTVARVGRASVHDQELQRFSILHSGDRKATLRGVETDGDEG